MELHIPTLALIAVSVTVILGALLLLAWRRDQSTDALVWWGVGYMLSGMAFGLLSARGNIPDVLSIELANTLLLVSYGFLYAGARAFSGRETPVTVFLIAPLIWLTAMRVPAIAGDLGARAFIVTSMQVVLVAMTTYEFWRQRAEPLLSRWPTMILMTIHAAALLSRMTAMQISPVFSHADLFRSAPFAVMAFGTVLYTIALAFLLLSMTKERSELRHKIAALVDPLTGLANRRAFMIDADTLIAARASRSEPLAVLVADLDHFKRINDLFGHAIGDEVLKVFADTLRRNLGANELVGRLGGEEFAILLPAAQKEAALERAERLRRAFAHAAFEVGGHAVSATVSIGVAASRIGAHDLSALLGRADAALYQAKESGRDRIAAFAEEPGPQPTPPVPAPVKLRLAS